MTLYSYNIVLYFIFKKLQSLLITFNFVNLFLENISSQLDQICFIKISLGFIYIYICFTKTSFYILVCVYIFPIKKHQF